MKLEKPIAVTMRPIEAEPNAHCPNLNKNPLIVPGPPNNRFIIPPTLFFLLLLLFYFQRKKNQRKNPRFQNGSINGDSLFLFCSLSLFLSTFGIWLQNVNCESEFVCVCEREREVWEKWEGKKSVRVCVGNS